MAHVRISTETKRKLEIYKQENNIQSIDKAIDRIYKRGVIKR